MKSEHKSTEQSATEGLLPGQVPHVRVRCMEDFSADELALLQLKLEGWMRTVETRSEGKRPRHRFVMKVKSTEQL